MKILATPLPRHWYSFKKQYLEEMKKIGTEKQHGRSLTMGELEDKIHQYMKSL